LSVLAEVHPARVRLLNQSNFPAATPTLELFLARNRVVHIAKVLNPHKAVQIIPFCKSFYFSGPMLVRSPPNVVRDPDVQCGAVFGSENVHPVVVIAYLSQKESEMFRFAQHDKMLRFNHFTCAFAGRICASILLPHQSPPQ
jgi:hypothetical protein